MCCRCWLRQAKALYFILKLTHTAEKQFGLSQSSPPIRKHWGFALTWDVHAQKGCGIMTDVWESKCRASCCSCRPSSLPPVLSQVTQCKQYSVMAQPPGLKDLERQAQFLFLCSPAMWLWVSYFNSLNFACSSVKWRGRLCLPETASWEVNEDDAPKSLAWGVQTTASAQ